MKKFLFVLLFISFLFVSGCGRVRHSSSRGRHIRPSHPQRRYVRPTHRYHRRPARRIHVRPTRRPSTGHPRRR